MNITAIITEYNPFHLGHAYQLSQIKSDFVIAIMSGNFVQRGEPALVDKWTRTQMALANGIDLVLELPCTLATGSAEYFAQGAIFLLSQSQIVNHLAFGAEHPNLDDLQAIATFLAHESKEFSTCLQAGLKTGKSFAAARQDSLQALLPQRNYAQILKGSNNILAIEYLKAIFQIKSPIEPCLIQRQGQAYLAGQYQKNTILSATAIRNLIADSRPESKKLWSHALPPASCQILTRVFREKIGPVFPQDIFHYLRFLLIHHKKEDLVKIWDLSPDLLNRIYRYSGYDLSYDQFIEACASRNFPISRVKRALLHVFLNQTKPNPLTANNSYLKVLGFRRSASLLVRYLQDHALLPVITNTRNIRNLSSQAYQLYHQELTYDDLYGQILKHKFNQALPASSQRNPIII